MRVDYVRKKVMMRKIGKYKNESRLWKEKGNEVRKMGKYKNEKSR